MTISDWLNEMSVKFDELGFVPTTLTDEKSEHFIEWFATEISEIKKEEERFKAENTELKARLKNAVELKAKVGDTIYLPWEYDGVYGIATLHITSITILGSGVFYITDFDCGADYIYSEKYKNGVYLNTDFKVTVFTNCAEAEAKLAELRCNI